MHKRSDEVDPGIGVKLELSILRKNGKISENQVLNFKRDVVSFLSKICTHLAEESPIKLSFPRNSRCFIPSLLFENSESSEARYLHVLENLVTAQQNHRWIAEQAKQQFPKFLEIAKENKQSFANLIPQKKVTALILFTGNILKVPAQLKKLPRF